MLCINLYSIFNCMGYFGQGAKCFTLSMGRGGGGGSKKMLDVQFSSFVAPLPLISDRSLHD